MILVIPDDMKAALGLPAIDPTPHVEICEGVESVYHYHLRFGPGATYSLCNHLSMHTGAPLESWGFVGPSHMPIFAYCDTCRALAGYG